MNVFISMKSWRPKEIWLYKKRMSCENLLSMSWRALTCIQETPSISSKSYAPQFPQYLTQKFTERTLGTPHIESSKLLAKTYMNDGIRFILTRHENLEFKYLYSKINDNQQDEYVKMKEKNRMGSTGSWRKVVMATDILEKSS